MKCSRSLRAPVIHPPSFSFSVTNETPKMSSHPEKSTIVLVQGSFQLPDVYYKLADALRSSGHPVVQPPLPSLTDPDEPDFTSKTLSDDALAIRTEIKRFVDEGKTVIIVMHSYGGLVGNEAVNKDLSFDQRQAHGLPGGVGKHSQSLVGNFFTV